MEDEPRFRKFGVWNFQVRSNIKWKIYPFFEILCIKNHWFSSRFSLFWEVWRFEVRFQRTNLGSEGSVFLRFGKFMVWYFQIHSKSTPKQKKKQVYTIEIGVLRTTQLVDGNCSMSQESSRN